MYNILTIKREVGFMRREADRKKRKKEDSKKSPAPEFIGDYVLFRAPKTKKQKMKMLIQIKTIKQKLFLKKMKINSCCQQDMSQRLLLLRMMN